MNAKKRIFNLLIAGVLILLQLSPTILYPQNINTSTFPNQSNSEPNISELFIETNASPTDFFLGIDKKCDLIVMANDPDWDMIRINIYIQFYEKGNMTKELIHTIWYPQNGERYRINLIPFLISYQNNLNIEAEVIDPFEMKSSRIINLNVNNIFGKEYFRDNRGRDIFINRTWVLPSQKDRNVQKIDIFDPQYLCDEDYKEKQDYEFNLTLVWDQRSNSSDKMYFGFRAGHFIQQSSYDSRFQKIYDSTLPSNYNSILAGEEFRNDWSRIAGFYFLVQPVNESDLIMPCIIKVKYPAWYEPEDPQNKPLRLLRFNTNNSKWELMDQSSIVKKAELNTVELFINSTDLYAFGRYSWDYEEELRNLERNDSIPGFPLGIFSAVSIFALVSLIINSKRKFRENSAKIE